MPNEIGAGSLFEQSGGGLKHNELENATMRPLGCVLGANSIKCSLTRPISITSRDSRNLYSISHPNAVFPIRKKWPTMETITL